MDIPIEKQMIDHRTIVVVEGEDNFYISISPFLREGKKIVSYQLTIGTMGDDDNRHSLVRHQPKSYGDLLIDLRQFRQFIEKNLPVFSHKNLFYIELALPKLLKKYYENKFNLSATSLTDHKHRV